ncbi:hypothetical protein [Polynucleobacter rarus]|uniref:hypothetical protein n=1 Tax=Polynucleobacter rarus TaxID=556055 RepID=UPI000D3EDC46|nr:hypothetical protein [Polynucleobacter rarus]
MKQKWELKQELEHEKGDAGIFKFLFLMLLLGLILVILFQRENKLYLVIICLVVLGFFGAGWSESSSSARKTQEQLDDLD